eukprot:CFRG0104T1
MSSTNIVSAESLLQASHTYRELLSRFNEYTYEQTEEKKVHMDWLSTFSTLKVGVSPSNIDAKHGPASLLLPAPKSTDLTNRPNITSQIGYAQAVVVKQGDALPHICEHKQTVSTQSMNERVLLDTKAYTSVAEKRATTNGETKDLHNHSTHNDVVHRQTDKQLPSNPPLSSRLDEPGEELSDTNIGHDNTISSPMRPRPGRSSAKSTMSAASASSDQTVYGVSSTIREKRTCAQYDSLNQSVSASLHVQASETGLLHDPTMQGQPSDASNGSVRDLSEQPHMYASPESNSSYTIESSSQLRCINVKGGKNDQIENAQIGTPTLQSSMSSTCSIKDKHYQISEQAKGETNETAMIQGTNNVRKTTDAKDNGLFHAGRQDVSTSAQSMCDTHLPVIDTPPHQRGSSRSVRRSARNLARVSIPSQTSSASVRSQVPASTDNGVHLLESRRSTRRSGVDRVSGTSLSDQVLEPAVVQSSNSTRSSSIEGHSKLRSRNRINEDQSKIHVQSGSAVEISSTGTKPSLMSPRRSVRRSGSVHRKADTPLHLGVEESLSISERKRSVSTSHNDSSPVKMDSLPFTPVNNIVQKSNTSSALQQKRQTVHDPVEKSSVQAERVIGSSQDRTSTSGNRRSKVELGAETCTETETRKQITKTLSLKNRKSTRGHIKEHTSSIPIEAPSSKTRTDAGSLLVKQRNSGNVGYNGRGQSETESSLATMNDPNTTNTSGTSQERGSIVRRSGRATVTTSSNPTKVSTMLGSSQIRSLAANSSSPRRSRSSVRRSGKSQMSQNGSILAAADSTNPRTSFTRNQGHISGIKSSGEDKPTEVPTLERADSPKKKVTTNKTNSLGLYANDTVTKSVINETVGSVGDVGTNYENAVYISTHNAISREPVDETSQDRATDRNDLIETTRSRKATKLDCSMNDTQCAYANEIVNGTAVVLDHNATTYKHTKGTSNDLSGGNGTVSQMTQQHKQVSDAEHASDDGIQSRRIYGEKPPLRESSLSQESNIQPMEFGANTHRISDDTGIEYKPSASAVEQRDQDNKYEYEVGRRDNRITTDRSNSLGDNCIDVSMLGSSMITLPEVSGNHPTDVVGAKAQSTPVNVLAQNIPRISETKNEQEAVNISAQADGHIHSVKSEGTILNDSAVLSVSAVQENEVLNKKEHSESSVSRKLVNECNTIVQLAVSPPAVFSTPTTISEKNHNVGGTREDRLSLTDFIAVSSTPTITPNNRDMCGLNTSFASPLTIIQSSYVTGNNATRAPIGSSPIRSTPQDRYTTPPTLRRHSTTTNNPSTAVSAKAGKYRKGVRKGVESNLKKKTSSTSDNGNAQGYVQSVESPVHCGRSSGSKSANMKVGGLSPSTSVDTKRMVRSIAGAGEGGGMKRASALELTVQVGEGECDDDEEGNISVSAPTFVELECNHEESEFGLRGRGRSALIRNRSGRTSGIGELPPIATIITRTGKKREKSSSDGGLSNGHTTGIQNSSTGIPHTSEVVDNNIHEGVESPQVDVGVVEEKATRSSAFNRASYRVPTKRTSTHVRVGGDSRTQKLSNNDMPHMSRLRQTRSDPKVHKTGFPTPSDNQTPVHSPNELNVCQNADKVTSTHSNIDQHVNEDTKTPTQPSNATNSCDVKGGDKNSSEDWHRNQSLSDDNVTHTISHTELDTSSSPVPKSHKATGEHTSKVNTTLTSKKKCVNKTRGALPTFGPVRQNSHVKSHSDEIGSEVPTSGTRRQMPVRVSTRKNSTNPITKSSHTESKEQPPMITATKRKGGYEERKRRQEENIARLENERLRKQREKEDRERSRIAEYDSKIENERLRKQKEREEKERARQVRLATKRGGKLPGAGTRKRAADSITSASTVENRATKKTRQARKGQVQGEHENVNVNSSKSYSGQQAQDSQSHMLAGSRSYVHRHQSQTTTNNTSIVISTEECTPDDSDRLDVVDHENEGVDVDRSVSVDKGVDVRAVGNVGNDKTLSQSDQLLSASLHAPETLTSNHHYEQRLQTSPSETHFLMNEKPSSWNGTNVNMNVDGQLLPTQEHTQPKSPNKSDTSIQPLAIQSIPVQPIATHPTHTLTQARVSTTRLHSSSQSQPHTPSHTRPLAYMGTDSATLLLARQTTLMAPTSQTSPRSVTPANGVDESVETNKNLDTDREAVVKADFNYESERLDAEQKEIEAARARVQQGKKLSAVRRFTNERLLSQKRETFHKKSRGMNESSTMRATDKSGQGIVKSKEVKETKAARLREKEMIKAREQQIEDELRIAEERLARIREEKRELEAKAAITATPKHIGQGGHSLLAQNGDTIMSRKSSLNGFGATLRHLHATESMFTTPMRTSPTKLMRMGSARAGEGDMGNGHRQFNGARGGGVLEASTSTHGYGQRGDRQTSQLFVKGTNNQEVSRTFSTPAAKRKMSATIASGTFSSICTGNAPKGITQPSQNVFKTPVTKNGVNNPSTTVFKTPTPVIKRGVKRRIANEINPPTQDDYDINDLRSDGSTDDEASPKKKVPSWAEGSNLRAALVDQYLADSNPATIFDQVATPKLDQIFWNTSPSGRSKKAKWNARTSSAYWKYDSPAGGLTRK